LLFTTELFKFLKADRFPSDAMSYSATTRHTKGENQSMQNNLKKLFLSSCIFAILLLSYNGNLFFAADLDDAAIDPYSAIVLEEFVFEKADFRSCHAATVLELKGGDLLCAFFSGSREGAPDVEIRMCRKPVGGAWTPPVSVADGDEPGSERMPTGNPVLFQERGGDVMLFYKVFDASIGSAGFRGRVKISKDGGHTWSEARKVGDGLIGPVKNKPIQLDDGSILSPSSTHGDSRGMRVHIERSTDKGKTWNLIGPVKKNPEAKISAIQPTLLTYADGRIQMLSRTASSHGFIAQSWSEDGGLTWSPLKPLILPNNNSGFDGVSLRDGRQLLVYNHSTRTYGKHKGRGILNVSLSHDGIAWEASLILDYLDESGKQFSYPAVIQSRDGLVHIVYTWHRKRIKHVVLNPKDLETVPMPDGKWPMEGPFSLKAFLQSQKNDGQSN
jgi:predicted neuraminidase